MSARWFLDQYVIPWHFQRYVLGQVESMMDRFKKNKKDFENKEIPLFSEALGLWERKALGEFIDKLTVKLSRQRDVIFDKADMWLRFSRKGDFESRAKTLQRVINKREYDACLQHFTSLTKYIQTVERPFIKYKLSVI